jgi:hypothetical protein
MYKRERQGRVLHTAAGRMDGHTGGTILYIGSGSTLRAVHARLG